MPFAFATHTNAKIITSHMKALGEAAFMIIGCEPTSARFLVFRRGARK